MNGTLGENNLGSNEVQVQDVHETEQNPSPRTNNLVAVEVIVSSE